MNDKDIAMSVIVIVGNDEYMRSLPFASLKSQTLADRMEILIMCFNERKKRSRSRSGWTAIGEAPEVRIIPLQKGETFLSARIKGVEHARGKIVAFLEDHCVADKRWAEKVMEAHDKPKQAVGFAFKNASPDRCVYRGIFFAEYGQWMHPALPDPVDNLPENNISYRRRDLLSLKGGAETNMAQTLFSPGNLKKIHGFSLVVAPAAIVGHQSFRCAKDAFFAHFHYSRMFGESRMKQEVFGYPRRILYAMAVPLVVPLLQVVRIFFQFRIQPRPPWLDLIMSLPLIFGIFSAGSIGESIGYMRGKGDAEKKLDEIELSAGRIGNT